MACGLAERVAASKSILSALKGVPAFADLSRSECERLMAELRVASLPVVEQGKIAELLKECGFVRADEDALLSLVAAKLVQAPATTPIAPPMPAQGKRAGMQDWADVARYFPTRVWEDMSSSDQKEPMFEFVDKLGMRHPSEPTMQAVGLAWLIMVEGTPEVEAMQPTQRTGFVKVVKQAWKALIRGWPSHTMFVITLPRGPTHFQASHRALWEHAMGSDAPAAKLPMKESSWDKTRGQT